MFPGAFRIDLLNSDLERMYSAKPERLRDGVERLQPGTVCCIDEIQRAEISDIVGSSPAIMVSSSSFTK